MSGLFVLLYYTPFDTSARDHLFQGKYEDSVFLASNDLRSLLYAYVLAMETSRVYALSRNYLRRKHWSSRHP